MSEKFTIRAHRDHSRFNTIALWFYKDTYGDQGIPVYGEAEPITFKEAPPNDVIRYREPTLRISTEEAQQFMDSLLEAGLRPAGGAGSVGQMAATEKHLNDLQRLVFKDKK